jgi:hypothetical protein
MDLRERSVDSLVELYMSKTLDLITPRPMPSSMPGYSSATDRNERSATAA